MQWVVDNTRYLPQPELLDFCRQYGIHVMAHQPLGGRPLAAVNPNKDRPGPLEDSEVSHGCFDANFGHLIINH